MEYGDGSTMLLIDHGIILFRGAVQRTGRHRHHAIQIAFGLRGRFSVRVGDTALSPLAILIGSDVEHRHTSDAGEMLSVFVDPESTLGDMIARQYDTDYACLDRDEVCVDRLLASLRSDGGSMAGVASLLTRYMGLDMRDVARDPRIERLVRMLRTRRDDPVSIQDLADRIGLSASRMQHLFKARTGVSIKRFMLWNKIIDGVTRISHGRNFTRAAYEAGFADSAHMSRTFTTMFGINLSQCFGNSTFVQASRPEPGL